MSAWLAALTQADRAVFSFVNGTLYFRPLADLTAALADDYVLLGLLLAAAAVYLLWRGWRAGLPALGAGFLAIALSSLLHNEWLKPFFHRTRPFLSLADVHLSAGLRDLAAVSSSFPSTHSSSAVALAIVVGAWDPALRWPAWAFAAGVGFGSIYSGGHYPADVLAGYAVGGLLGWTLAALGKGLWPGWGRIYRGRGNS